MPLRVSFDSNLSLVWKGTGSPRIWNSHFLTAELTINSVKPEAHNCKLSIVLYLTNQILDLWRWLCRSIATFVDTRQTECDTLTQLLLRKIFFPLQTSDLLGSHLGHSLSGNDRTDDLLSTAFVSWDIFTVPVWLLTWEPPDFTVEGW